MKQNKFLLVVGLILLGIGVLKPDLSNLPIINPSPNSVCNIENYVIDAPSDTELLKASKYVTDILNASDDSTKKSDCLKLSALYADMATLIELDNEDKVINDTASIREANSLAGKMLRLDIKNKYLGLADACRLVVITAIGEEEAMLNKDTRSKACEAFRTLSWAFYEGSK